MDPRLKGVEVRHGGRTINIQVFVNTDEDVNAVIERVRVAAQGEQVNMVLVGGGVLTKEKDKADAERMWASSISAAKERLGKKRD